jgi:putative membrane protein
MIGRVSGVPNDDGGIMKSEETCGRDLGKGVLAGVVGGLIGTIVMTEFQNAWAAASQKLKKENSGEHSGNDQDGESQQEKESATMKAAGKLGEVAGYRPSHEQKKKLAPVVHYGFGTLQGAAYGLTLELVRNPGGMVAGLAFGTALFVLADEVAVPAFELSDKPSEIPVSSHLYGLAAHLVYGISAEIARRGMRAILAAAEITIPQEPYGNDVSTSHDAGHSYSRGA